MTCERRTIELLSSPAWTGGHAGAKEGIERKLAYNARYHRILAEPPRQVPDPQGGQPRIEGLLPEDEGRLLPVSRRGRVRRRPKR